MSNAQADHRESTYPPPYPDGWYRIAASREIGTGQVRHVQCAGEQIALFRGRTDGRLAAVDAFCPHLGANLAYGTVEGDRIQCPFHGWQLDGSGGVFNCPDAEGLRHTHRHWEVVDYYGMVMMYRSARPDTDPPYRLPPEPRIDDGRFALRGQHDAGEVNMHIIEFAENSVDYRHFSEIHDAMRIPWTNIRVPGTRIRHAPSWHTDDELGHVSYFRDVATLEIAGRVRESTRADALITFLGPGSIVKFEFSIPRIGEIVMFQTHTPVAPLMQRTTFRWFAPRRVPRILVSYVIGNWISQWRQDADIWKRKIYRKQPHWIRGDGPLGRMRRWYRQFYPEDPPGAAPEGVPDGN